jgi:peptidoglycan/LPS O-acetylase OafA/YrhL
MANRTLQTSQETSHTPWSERFLARFRRVTSSGNFISEIDGLRFIAIGTVVLFHLVVNLSFKSPIHYAVPSSGNVLVSIARYGFHGVELFFIISGFILAYPFASYYLKGRKHVNLRQYFLRRLTRLEPPYFICMILYFLLRVYVRGEGGDGLFPHLAASLLYSHNLIFGGESLINNVAWSLEIEVQFYLLVPLLSRVFSINNTVLRRSLIVGGAFLVVLHQWFFIGPESWMYLTIIRFLQFFLIGFLLADIFLLDWKEQPTRHFGWDVVSLVGWPLLFVIWNHPELSHAILPVGQEPVLEAFLFPLISFFLYQAVFRGPMSNRIMTNVWITTIGGMCYTIYLFHNQLIGGIALVTGGIAATPSYTLNVLIQGVLVIPPMLVVCVVYFRLIERPCMRKDWPKRAVVAASGFFVRTSLKERAAQSNRS